jgi:hypothetical protein
VTSSASAISIPESSLVIAWRLSECNLAQFATSDEPHASDGGLCAWKQIASVSWILGDLDSSLRDSAVVPGRSICLRVVKNQHIDLLSSPRHSGYAGNAMHVLAALADQWKVSLIVGANIRARDDAENYEG